MTAAGAAPGAADPFPFSAWHIPRAGAAPMVLPGAIVGFSFSLESGSVAVRDPQGRIHERVLEGHRSHANDALPAVRELLSVAGVPTAAVLAVAADVGPGGFTGLRTACAMAQGLATGWNVPCIGVSSLSLMACAALMRNPRDGLCVAALDARQREVYVAAWRCCDGRVEPVMPASLRPYASGVRAALGDAAARSLTAALPPASADALLAVGPGVALLTVPDEQCIAEDASVLPAAGVLVELAAQAFNAGRMVDPVHCQPLYVRSQIAMTTAQRLAGAGV